MAENKIQQNIQVLLVKHVNGGKKETALFDTSTGRAWVERFDSTTQQTKVVKEFVAQSKK
jgi:hypothetical protein